jgi:hypothetical protein
MGGDLAAADTSTSKLLVNRAPMRSRVRHLPAARACTSCSSKRAQNPVPDRAPVCSCLISSIDCLISFHVLCSSRSHQHDNILLQVCLACIPLRSPRRRLDSCACSGTPPVACPTQLYMHASMLATLSTSRRQRRPSPADRSRAPVVILHT